MGTRCRPPRGTGKDVHTTSIVLRGAAARALELVFFAAARAGGHQPKVSRRTEYADVEAPAGACVNATPVRAVPIVRLSFHD